MNSTTTNPDYGPNVTIEPAPDTGSTRQGRPDEVTVRPATPETPPATTTNPDYPNVTITEPRTAPGAGGPSQEAPGTTTQPGGLGRWLFPRPEGYPEGASLRDVGTLMNPFASIEEKRQAARRDIEGVFPVARSLREGEPLGKYYTPDTALGHLRAEGETRQRITDRLRQQLGREPTGAEMFHAWSRAPELQPSTFPGLSGAFGTRDIGTGTFGPGVSSGLRPTGITRTGPPVQAQPPEPHAGIQAEIAGQRAVKEIGPDITHAIRPGAGTRAQRSSQRFQLNRNIHTTLDQIIDNSQNLVYHDDLGNVVDRGRDPRDLADFAEAITQTKRDFWRNVIAPLVGRAHATGANVDTHPVYTALEAEANRPIYDVEPEERTQIMNAARRWLNRGSFTIPEAQDVLVSLNARLRPFYNNPAQEQVPIRTVINRIVAETLRDQTDMEIDNALGTNQAWSDARRQYGALKALEPFINNQYGIRARNQPHGGRGGIAGAVAGGLGWEELVRGLAEIATGHFDPTRFITSAALFGVKAYERYARNPATAVTRAFKRARERRIPARQPIGGIQQVPAPPDPYGTERDKPGTSLQELFGGDPTGNIGNYIGIPP